jgi:hypothetical protein
VKSLIRAGYAQPGSVLHQFIGYKQAIQFLKDENITIDSFREFLIDFQAKTR